MPVSEPADMEGGSEDSALPVPVSAGDTILQPSESTTSTSESETGESTPQQNATGDGEELDALFCARCSKVIALAKDIVPDAIDILKSDVFSYDLEIFDQEYANWVFARVLPVFYSVFVFSLRLCSVR